MLFATVSNRALANAGFYATEKRLLQQQFDNAALADVLSQMDLNAMTTTNNEIASPLQDGTKLVIQDVGGLIDLNTAAPELIAGVIDFLGLEPEAIEQYRTWQQDGRRLLQTDDFLRIVGEDMTLITSLSTIATVHSGERYVSNASSPESVRQIVAGLDEVFVDQPTSDSFAVRDTMSDQHILTVQNSNRVFHNLE